MRRFIFTSAPKIVAASATYTAEYLFNSNCNEVSGSYNATNSGCSYGTTGSTGYIITTSNKYVQGPDLGLSSTNIFTYSAWLSIKDASKRAMLFRIDKSGGRQVLLYLDTSDYSVWLSDASFGNGTAGSSYALDNWYHIVITYGGGVANASDGFKYYVDGTNKAITQSWGTQSSLAYEAAPFHFGQKGTDTTYMPTVWHSDLIIDKTVWTQTAITNYFNANKSKYSK